MIRVVCAMMLAGLMAGCAPGSPEAVRQHPQSVREVRLPAGYQEIYRTLVANSRRCYEIGLITANRQVRSDLYTDIGRGEITYEMVGALGRDVYATVDVIREGDGTLLRVHNGLGDYGPLVERWAKGGDC